MGIQFGYNAIMQTSSKKRWRQPPSVLPTAATRPGRGLVLALAALLIAPAGWGAHPWFSTRTAGNQSRPVAARPPEQAALPSRPDAKGPATLTNSLFDIVISLYNNPRGDDDGNTQGKIGSEEQDMYEYIIQYFADGVYEATEGKHALRTVRIYRNGRRF
jgi:hypothetical protein